MKRKTTKVIFEISKNKKKQKTCWFFNWEHTDNFFNRTGKYFFYVVKFQIFAPMVCVSQEFIQKKTKIEKKLHETKMLSLVAPLPQFSSSKRLTCSLVFAPHRPHYTPSMQKRTRSITGTYHRYDTHHKIRKPCLNLSHLR